jgi:hypothetical protein
MENHNLDNIQSERPKRPPTNIQATPPTAPVADSLPLLERGFAKRGSWWDAPLPVFDLVIGGSILIVLALAAVGFLGQVTNKTFSNIAICGDAESIQTMRQQLEREAREEREREERQQRRRK